MRKITFICSLSFFFIFICCKKDVGLDKNNTICLNISESKMKNVFQNNYLLKVKDTVKNIKILEAWSENVWFYENDSLNIDENNFNFNVSFGFENYENNFLNYNVSYVPNDYFIGGAYISNVYKSTFKKAIVKNDNLKLLLVVKNDTIPIEFTKTN